MRFAKEMAFYSAYHQEKRNIWIHVLGVPLISFTVLLLLSNFAIYTLNGFPLTVAMAFTVVVLLYYFTLDVLFAFISTVLFGGLLAIAHYLVHVSGLSMTTVWIVFAAGQIIGWGSQFYGHFIFEKDRPALFDNLFQALVSAPIFVVADVVFELGFRKDLEAQIKDVLKERGKLKTFDDSEATASA